MSDEPSGGSKESKVEAVKRESNYLRGHIAETLASGATHFEEAETQLLKTHGTYQQDDRDERRARRDAHQDKAYQFMVRTAIPGGVLTAEQYLALDKLGDDYANGSLRVTTRQGCQFHGVLMGDLKKTIAEINQVLLTTLSACGDVERNVMACPAPLADAPHKLVRELAREIAVQLRPASRAYHEIWLDEEKVVTTEEQEPFYGAQYLPRKFKSGISIDRDNCVDIYSYDCGLVAVIDAADKVGNGHPTKVRGFNVLVGGGMGMTHGKADTMAKLAEPLGFVDVEHAVETVRTVAAIFRDHGNRADRRHSRLKYLIAERGMDWMAEEFRRRVSFTLSPAVDLPPPECPDHLGRHEQGDGKWFYGVFVANGRIVDADGTRYKAGLREVIRRFRPGVRFTGHQNVLLTDLDEKTIDEIEKILRDHGVTPADELSAARRFSMACPALPTCGLAMAESERIMPTVVDMLEAELTRLGLRDAPLTIRMTGCPNGCARPYTADIAFVGRKPDVYHVYVGGGMGGDRVVDLFAADVDVKDIVTTLRPLLSNYARTRRGAESLSDYYQRLAQHEKPRLYVTGKEDATASLLKLEVIQ